MLEFRWHSLVLGDLQNNVLSQERMWGDPCKGPSDAQVSERFTTSDVRRRFSEEESKGGCGKSKGG